MVLPGYPTDCCLVPNPLVRSVKRYRPVRVVLPAAAASVGCRVSRAPGRAARWRQVLDGMLRFRSGECRD